MERGLNMSMWQAMDVYKARHVSKSTKPLGAGATQLSGVQCEAAAQWEHSTVL